MKRPFILGAAALSLLLTVGTAARVAGQQRGLSAFMRPKLEHSKMVLEGLTLENFDLIGKNARAMKELSEGAEWRVSPSATYLRYSGEFQRLADELEERARAKNLDGATLTYVQLTINCVNCHKFVKDNKITALSPPPRAFGE